MLDQFIYENHLGQRFDGLANGVYLNTSELRNYTWSYQTINSRISRFYRKTTNRKIPLFVVGQTDAQAIEAMNRLLDITEADVALHVPGKIFVGEYYTTGFVTVSKKTEYLQSKQLCKMEMTLTSDDPAWYRDEVHSFYATKNADTTTGLVGGFDYPYEYNLEYAIQIGGRSIANSSYTGNAFRIMIYGAAINPTVIIGGHPYTVNGAVGEGETLTIDSMTKTITLTTETGSKINYFDKRDRQNYIFQPIQPGQNAVAWSGDFGFELTVIEERSEPKWT